MSREIAYLPEVSQDFVDASNYYEALAEGLGQKFEAAYFQAENSVEAGIPTHRVVFENYRRVVIQGFPYLLYYRLDGSRAVIVGVFFAKRDPESTKRALTSRKK
jgi:plasmid stabilization system protein ParE